MTQPRVRYGISTTSDYTFWTDPMPLEATMAADATVADIAEVALAWFDRMVGERATFRFYDGLEHRAVATAHIVSVRLDILDSTGSVMAQ